MAETGEEEGDVSHRSSTQRRDNDIMEEEGRKAEQVGV